MKRASAAFLEGQQTFFASGIFRPGKARDESNAEAYWCTPQAGARSGTPPGRNSAS
jgi:hypothetical protein